VWDVSGTEMIVRDRALALTGALARGIGWRTEAESGDMLMQDAPKDLYTAIRDQLLNPQQYSADEIVRRKGLLDQTIVDQRAPLHSNCYLSPSQFAAKFKLLSSVVPRPTKVPESVIKMNVEVEGDNAPAPTPGSGACPAHSITIASAGPARPYVNPNASATKTALHSRHLWVVWLALTWALVATALAGLSAIGIVWR
jgi:hypothetical protein